jgi:hypothetical protein
MSTSIMVDDAKGPFGCTEKSREDEKAPLIGPIADTSRPDSMTARRVGLHCIFGGGKR